MSRRCIYGLVLATLCLGGDVFSPQAGAAGDVGGDGLSSQWSPGYKSRTRLSAGRAAEQKAGKYWGFVEIQLDEEWRTYWRNPGDSGIPPRFEFGKSQNLKSAKVLYPAPRRITGKGETIVGYTGTVLFPIELTAADASQPIVLDAGVQFGMCKDICVPSEASLQLAIPPDIQSGLSSPASASLADVPRTGDLIAAADPHAGTVAVDAATKKLSFTAQFPGGTDGADAFLEAPDGLYLPLPVKVSETQKSATFEADLSSDVDLAALAGKTITLTLVSRAGSSQTDFAFH